MFDSFDASDWDDEPVDSAGTAGPDNATPAQVLTSVSVCRRADFGGAGVFRDEIALNHVAGKSNL